MFDESEEEEAVVPNVKQGVINNKAKEGNDNI